MKLNSLWNGPMLFNDAVTFKYQQSIGNFVQEYGHGNGILSLKLEI